VNRADMSTLRTHFTFRVDTWTAEGESIVEHVAGVEDYQVALATFCAACERWPGTPITLRQGARVIEDSRRLRMAQFRAKAGRRQSQSLGVSPRSQQVTRLLCGYVTYAYVVQKIALAVVFDQAHIAVTRRSRILTASRAP